MFDGIKIQDVSVDVDSLLTNDRLTFTALVDPQTGFVFDPIRRVTYRGLTFRLVPRRTSPGHLVEVKGSLHKFYNQGQHNADQFKAADLLLTLDQLVMDYSFDPFSSKINNIEFGVNVVLPFPVDEVLQNLISYKNKPFYRDTHSKAPYYECRFQRFTLKLYDKGKQRGLDDHLLRVEIKVTKMEYFKNMGVRLNMLADLVNVANYEPLGALLVDTFNKIRFDDSTINLNRLTPREREIYQNGRNPRFWSTPDPLPANEYERKRKALQRTEVKFRAVLDQHRQGEDRQRQTAALISQTWQRLTRLTPDLLKAISDHKLAWKNKTKPDSPPGIEQPDSRSIAVINPAANCPKLTGGHKAVCCEVAVKNLPATSLKITGPTTNQMSQINPLYSALQCDNTSTSTDPIICPVTRVEIQQPRPGQRFVSPTMLRTDDDLLLSLIDQFRQYGKGSKVDIFSRVAKNVRNRDSNDRHNLRRAINKIYRQPTLFDVSKTVRLTPEQRAALDYWQGTPYEVLF